MKLQSLRNVWSDLINILENVQRRNEELFSPADEIPALVDGQELA